MDAGGGTLMVWVLRDEIGLTGTKFGCGIAQCGSCTIHVDGEAKRSCVTPLSSVLGKEITTIEGLSTDLTHPLQKAWIEGDVAQCGYCQSGQIMAAATLLKNNKKPTDADIDAAAKKHSNVKMVFKDAQNDTLKQRAHKEAKVKAEAEKFANMLVDKTIKIGAKVGEKGKIFGSVNTIMLADAFKMLGVEIDRKHIKLKGEAIKTVGKYEAEVVFHRDLIKQIPGEVVEE